MDIETAMTVKKGDKIISKLTTTPYVPLRVTQVWVSNSRTIVRFRVFSLRGTRFDESGAWLDSSSVELAPKGKRWNTATLQWEAEPATA